ncbi:uncharacterized protein ELE39_001581 [Cryptosporidium sp. chipmunk genotype I]|uniref:uncharacterized protein n=1 Tax=Cryptosporidium sp. chipmunk genotype I TaxID=1280935 RepID=UPI00351AA8EF|nr:hypothetical protein ELE39_001581 [Cryptosporidium sp. chipmunk genotype I]
MSTNNLKSSLYSSLFLSNGHSSKLYSEVSDNNDSSLKIKNSDIKSNNSKFKIINKQISLNNCEKLNIKVNSNFDNIAKSSNTIKYNSGDLTIKNDSGSINLKKFSLINRFDNQSIGLSNKDSIGEIRTNKENIKYKPKNKVNSKDFKVLEEKKIQVNQENKQDKNLFITGKADYLLNIKDNENLEKEVKYDVYLRSNLIKVVKDENNEVIISVPCRLNMDLESLFYYFSNNSIYLKCNQFASMLHFSKLYHKSKPIDTLGRMFPSSQENLPIEERQIEYNSFLKLLHRFSQFKFKSTGATENEKLNLVVSFLLSCDYVDIISNKLVKSERCIQVNDPAMQRKDKDIQISAEFRDGSTQMEQIVDSVAVDATYSVSDASCYCDIEQELNLTNIQKEFDEPSNEEHQNQVFDYLNIYNIQDQPKLQDIVVKPELCEINQQSIKKNERKNSQKKTIQKSSDPESEILIALTSINQEDDKKLYRIFVYYSGPNNDRLSYRQFYNLMNDSGLLGGNFEEYLTPVQLERCYSAVITNPKGLDYWEFKETLLYCGEASCGNDPTSAFQSIIRKYIIPLILMIYQPNNFEKCEDAVLNQSFSEEFESARSLQTMINKAILPWFRLGNRPVLSDESDEYSDTCSCSSFDSNFDSFEDKQFSISSSHISSSLKEEN